MRKLTWFAGGFGVACLFACYGLGGVWAAVTAAVLLVLAAAVWLRARPKPAGPTDVRQFPRLRRAAFEAGRRLTALFLGALLAFGWFAAYAGVFYQPTKELAGTERTISGTVTSYPVETSIGG